MIALICGFNQPLYREFLFKLYFRVIVREAQLPHGISLICRLGIPRLREVAFIVLFHIKIAETTLRAGAVLFCGDAPEVRSGLEFPLVFGVVRVFAQFLDLLQIHIDPPRSCSDTAAAFCVIGKKNLYHIIPENVDLSI